MKREGVVGGELDVAVETGRVEEGRGGVDVGNGEAEGPLQESVGLVENTASNIKIHYRKDIFVLHLPVALI